MLEPPFGRKTRLISDTVDGAQLTLRGALLAHCTSTIPHVGGDRPGSRQALPARAGNSYLAQHYWGPSVNSRGQVTDAQVERPAERLLTVTSRARAVGRLSLG